MKKLESSLRNMIMSLGAITAAAALILAIVYNITKGPIADVERQAKIDAIAQVVPEFDNDPMTDTMRVEGVTVHVARKGGEIVGGAVESSSMNGFSGEIKVMYGFGIDGSVTGYQVLSHAETPGLGAKMGEWFRDTTARRSVIGVNPGAADMRVSKDGGDIDGITAATISSRAFLDALERAYKAFQTIKPQSDETAEDNN